MANRIALKVFSTLLVLLMASSISLTAHAQEMAFGGNPKMNSQYSFGGEYWYLDGGDRSDFHSPAMYESKGTLQLPVLPGEKTSLSFSGRGQRIKMQNAIPLGGSGLFVPSDIASVDMGFSLVREFESKDNGGVSFTTTFSGEYGEVFQNNPAFSATVFYDWKKENGDSWVWAFNYANNRATLNHIPLPGFAYVMNRKSFTGVFGLPFLFLNVRTEQRVGFSLTASPFFASSEINYFVVMPVQLFSNVSWQPKSWENVPTESDDQRLIYDRKEWSTGVRIPFGRSTFVSASYSYALDRRFFVGESLSKPSSPKAVLNDTGNLQLKGRYSF